MALKKDYVLSNGLVVNGAYIKIDTCSSTKSSATARFGIYKDKEFAKKGQSICDQYHIFQPDYSDGAMNLWKQGYENLKTLPEFAEAVDV